MKGRIFMYSKEEIRQAVSAVQNGNISKWEVIDKAYRKKIEGYCAARSRNASEAEDLAQLTMMDAYRKIGSLRETDKLESWLFGIASHKCKDYNRQSSAQSGLPDNLAGETEEAEEAIEITAITIVNGVPQLTYPATYGNGQVVLQGSATIGSTASWHDGKQSTDRFFRTTLKLK